MKQITLSFKWTLLLVGAIFMVMALGFIAKGLMISMAEFQVPQEILNSPHYYDSMLWVYVHMTVLGLLILLIGISVTDLNKQKWIALILFVVHLFYAYLDFRTSDSMFGNGLYKGEASLIPAFMGATITFVFLLLTIGLFRKKA
jgi:hypothetical protein